MGARGIMGVAVAGWMVVGCGVAEPDMASAPSLETAEQKSVVSNDRGLNGPTLNGAFQGRMLVSARYDGARREGMGTGFDEVWLEGSALHGLMGGDEFSPLDFRQVRFTGTLDDGSPVTLRVDGVTQGSGADQDVWTYQVTYLEPSTGLWNPICPAADGTAQGAIALESKWDYRQGVLGGGSKVFDTASFTFACDGGALAKCVLFGYAPWRSVNGVSLEEHHQACTRMVRADYCGDGNSYTVSGNLINLYDSLEVQQDTEAWVPEAEWTSDGASCFSSQTRATTAIQCGERLVTSCGASFSPKTLLISETPPQN
jgi:hypothetical protein